MHHTIDKIPDKKDRKYSWQKKHLENQTGTDNRFQPTKIKKNNIKKNMKLGNKIYLFFILLFISISVLKAEEKITTFSFN